MLGARDAILVLALASCRDPEPPAPRPVPAPEVAVKPQPVPLAPPVPSPPVDAAVVVPVDAPPSRAPDRLVAYVDVLRLDLNLYSIVKTYPGVPPGRTFRTTDYEWRSADRDRFAGSSARARAASGTLAAPVDDAVRAYLDVVDKHLDALTDLVAYYTQQRFIDDEFDRGRRDAPLVARAAGDIAKVRGALWSSVLAAWLDAAGEVPDSPRAIITRAWEACMHVAESIVTVGLGDKTNRALGACRRSIPSVTALPPAIRHELDATLRKTAGELGNFLADGAEWRISYAGVSLWILTDDYLALWPVLPTTPAERAP